MKVLALTATVATPFSAASARGYRHYHGYRHHHSRNAAAAGLIGLAAGALIGSVLAQPSQSPRVLHRDPTPAYYPPVPQVYPRSSNMQPWTQDWYNYCSQKFRSFNPQTGTYRGYDGRNHFCNTS